LKYRPTGSYLLGCRLYDSREFPGKIFTVALRLQILLTGQLESCGGFRAECTPRHCASAANSAFIFAQDIRCITCLVHFSPPSFLSAALLIPHRTRTAFLLWVLTSNRRIHWRRICLHDGQCALSNGDRAKVFLRNIRCVHSITSAILRPLFY
jgi:hypothetical protein